MILLSTPFFPLLAIVFGVLLFLFLLYFAFVSWKEEEPLALKRVLLLAFLLPLPYFLAGSVPFKGQWAVCILLIGIPLIILILFLLPIGNKIYLEDDNPKGQIDERDIMFSRKSLEPGTERFNAYYKNHPEKKRLDDNFRKRPGLMQKEALYYDPITASAAEASFITVSSFHSLLDENITSEYQENINEESITLFIKQWTKKLGAVSVGITKLQKYHLYHTIGRGERYGEPAKLNHKYAIAFTVEMNKPLLDRAPYGPTVMESAQQYLNSGAIAVQIAEFIKQLGYPARAHIDGSYRVVCPLVARDAGLGEIGRMGILMTPELGPRVRLAVVTTDLPLIADTRKRDNSVIDFCRMCKKCADVCPSKSISFDDRENIDGVLRWQIDSESCFTYWCSIGTDCGRCMSVCPYSHPNNFLHNLVRFGIKRSVLFRWVALKMDDFFYGRKPAPLDLPDWIKNGVK